MSHGLTLTPVKSSDPDCTGVSAALKKGASDQDVGGKTSVVKPLERHRRLGACTPKKILKFWPQMVDSEGIFMPKICYFMYDKVCKI